MALPLEDYALIGDTQTAALVGRDGSIDWLCLPRFDSDACFAALLGDERHGRWLLAPGGGLRATTRRYRPGSLVLETEFTTEDGVVRVTDAMPPRKGDPGLVRVVEGVRGRVAMELDLVARFGYGAVEPSVRPHEHGFLLVAGPDALRLRSTAPLRLDGAAVRASFSVDAGQRVSFGLTWQPSHQAAREHPGGDEAIERTEAWWCTWSRQSSYKGPWRDEVLRSLVTVKALTYGPTGGIVAAPTTSLPESLGGARNWDYRYCWLRDVTFTLHALLLGGFKDAAGAWREWLLRAVAGNPSQLQIVYGAGGERRLTEFELPWLPGYAHSRPVRVGNAAVNQFQLDVFGEVMDCLHQARVARLEVEDAVWTLQQSLLDFLESHWESADDGIWEVRGGSRQFTHSKVMAWVALDRAVKGVERLGLRGPVDRWRSLRAEIHDDVCEKGYDPERQSFTQFYGSRSLDASLLMIPLVGFLPPSDERVVGTVAAIERELFHDGFVLRYTPDESVEHLRGREGAFLPCTFWLADNYILLGRRPEALELFERLLDLRNDVGLLSEEYDPVARRLVGNFPQAFTHVALVNTAMNLASESGPAKIRSDRG